MGIRTPLPLAAAFLLLLGCQLAGPRAGAQTLILRATRSALLADGKQTTDILAEVRDTSGRPGAAFSDVQFQTSAGTLSASHAPTIGGVARVRLTAPAVAGVAHVTAFAPGGGAGSLDILITDDPSATFEGNNYMLVTGSGYLAYSVTDRVIEANGKEGGARVTYRNIDITADRLQLRCDDGILRAHDNITLKRGNNTVKARRLYYSLLSGQGYAILDEESLLKTVVLSGDPVRQQPSTTSIPSSYLSFPDLQVKLIIVSKGVTYFPNDRLQFRRARFFQDQAQIMALPYYELPLNSQELFSDQFISVGTRGFGLELPFYYNLTPRSTGIVYLRHQQQQGRSTFATTPGWAIDVLQGYSAQGPKRYEGMFGFTGLTRGDWGFRWNHTQEFGGAGQGTLYLDLPHHDSIFSSASYSQQNRVLRWGANVSGGQTLRGPGVTSSRGDLYVETLPHRLAGAKGLMYTLDSGIGSGSTRTSLADVAGLSETTESVGIRAFTRPWTIDSRTTLNNSFRVGQIWSSLGHSGPMEMATLSLDHTIAGGSVMNLTYDFVHQPAGIIGVNGTHRVSLSYTRNGSGRFNVNLFGSAFLDAPAATFLADMSYRVSREWRLITSATLQTYSDQRFRDLEIVIGRRLGARELQLSYSTLYHRFSFDLTTTRF